MSGGIIMNKKKICIKVLSILLSIIMCFSMAVLPASAASFLGGIVIGELKGIAMGAIMPEIIMGLSTVANENEYEALGWVVDYVFKGESGRLTTELMILCNQISAKVSKITGLVSELDRGVDEIINEIKEELGDIKIDNQKREISTILSNYTIMLNGPYQDFLTEAEEYAQMQEDFIKGEVTEEDLNLKQEAAKTSVYDLVNRIEQIMAISSPDSKSLAFEYDLRKIASNTCDMYPSTELGGGGVISTGTNSLQRNIYEGAQLTSAFDHQLANAVYAAQQYSAYPAVVILHTNAVYLQCLETLHQLDPKNYPSLTVTDVSKFQDCYNMTFNMLDDIAEQLYDETSNFVRDYDTNVVYEMDYKKSVSRKIEGANPKCPAIKQDAKRSASEMDFYRVSVDNTPYLILKNTAFKDKNLKFSDMTQYEKLYYEVMHDGEEATATCKVSAPSQDYYNLLSTEDKRYSLLNSTQELLRFLDTEAYNSYRGNSAAYIYNGLAGLNGIDDETGEYIAPQINPKFEYYTTSQYKTHYHDPALTYLVCYLSTDFLVNTKNIQIDTYEKSEVEVKFREENSIEPSKVKDAGVQLIYKENKDLEKEKYSLTSEVVGSNSKETKITLTNPEDGSQLPSSVERASKMNINLKVAENEELVSLRLETPNKTLIKEIFAEDISSNVLNEDRELQLEMITPWQDTVVVAEVRPVLAIEAPDEYEYKSFSNLKLYYEDGTQITDTRKVVAGTTLNAELFVATGAELAKCNLVDANAVDKNNHPVVINTLATNETYKQNADEDGVMKFTFTMPETACKIVTTTKIGVMDGTKKNPYIINNIHDLEMYAQYSENDNWPQDMNYDITNDIDGRGKIIKGFSKLDGTIHGNGHTLSDYNIQDGDPLVDQITGLGKIENLFIDVQYYKEAKYLTKDSAVFATINDGNINNCGILENSSLTIDGNKSGRLAGITVTNRGTILNCFNKAAGMTATEVAGLVNVNQGEIFNCYSWATMTNLDQTVNNFSGVVTENGGKIKNTYFVSSFEIPFASKYTNFSRLTNCYTATQSDSANGLTVMNIKDIMSDEFRDTLNRNITSSSWKTWTRAENEAPSFINGSQVYSLTYDFNNLANSVNLTTNDGETLSNNIAAGTAVNLVITVEQDWQPEKLEMYKLGDSDILEILKELNFEETSKNTYETTFLMPEENVHLTSEFRDISDKSNDNSSSVEDNPSSSNNSKNTNNESSSNTGKDAAALKTGQNNYLLIGALVFLALLVLVAIIYKRKENSLYIK